MTYSNLLLTIADGVATITLNRPESANSLDMATSHELMLAAIQCDEDPSVRAVVITAVGRMFSAGGDLKSFVAQGEKRPQHVKELTTYLHAAVSRFVRMDAPVIAAVNGTVAGGGMGLVVCADLVLAGESAKLTMAYTRAGLTPDASTSYFLPRLIGMRKALELTLLNPILSASEAVEWGLVNRVVADADLASEAHALAAQLAAGPTLAIGASKRLLRGAWNETLETQMELESREHAAIHRTADSGEGINAFLEKRPPVFKGE